MESSTRSTDPTPPNSPPELVGITDIEAENTGTPAQEILGDQSEFAQKFISDMKAHGMPGAIELPIDTQRQEARQDKNLLTKKILGRLGISVSNLDVGKVRPTIKGYEIGLIGTPLSVDKNSKPLKRKASGLNKPFNKVEVDTNKFSASSELSVSLINILQPDYLEHDASTRIDLKPVYLCEDGQLRTIGGKVIPNPRDEFRPGITLKTRYNPGQYRVYANELDRFYIVPLDMLLPALKIQHVKNAEDQSSENIQLLEALVEKKQALAKSREDQQNIEIEMSEEAMLLTPVNVRNDTGAIEGGWQIMGFGTSPEGEKIARVKKESSRKTRKPLEKIVKLSDLRSWQN